MKKILLLLSLFMSIFSMEEVEIKPIQGNYIPELSLQGLPIELQHQIFLFVFILNDGICDKKDFDLNFKNNIKQLSKLELINSDFYGLVNDKVFLKRLINVLAEKFGKSNFFIGFFLNKPDAFRDIVDDIKNSSESSDCGKKQSINGQINNDIQNLIKILSFTIFNSRILLMDNYASPASPLVPIRLVSKRSRLESCQDKTQRKKIKEWYRQRKKEINRFENILTIVIKAELSLEAKSPELYVQLYNSNEAWGIILYMATLRNWSNLIDLILGNFKDKLDVKNIKYCNENLLLLATSSKKRINALGSILKYSDKFDLNEVCFAYSPLLYAVLNNNLDAVKLLLGHSDKIDFNIRQSLRRGLITVLDKSVLMIAIKRSYEDILNLLLEHVDRMDLNLQDKRGYNVLYYAIRSRRPELVEQLLAATGTTGKVDIQHPKIYTNSYSCYNLLMAAIESKSEKIFELILTHTNKLDFESKTFDGQTVFILAVDICDFIKSPQELEKTISNILRLLFKRAQELGIDIESLLNQKDKKGRTALYYAKKKSYKEIENLLRANGAHD